MASLHHQRITMKRSASYLSLLICSAIIVGQSHALVDRSQSSFHRALEDYNNGYGNVYGYDLSGFSVHYDKCQYVKAYDDEVAADEESDSPLALKHFVLFRLCPTDECTQCDDSENYGKYITEVDDYLQYTVEQQKQIFGNMCQNCGEECGNGQACATECGQLCDQYGNMENYGLIDASEYMQCQEFEIPQNENGRRMKETLRRLKAKAPRRLEENNDQQDQEGQEEGEEQNNQEQEDNQADNEEQQQQEEEAVQLFIGPKCSQSGARIELALFSDENCWQPVDTYDVEDLLQGEISYYFLEHTYRSNGDPACLTCAENNENENQDDNRDADQVNEMCEGLYDIAAKCETPTGISAGFIQTKREDGVYENQVENEFLSCSFIDSLLANSYTEEGEIYYKGAQDVYMRNVTPLQGLAMALLTLWFVILFGLMQYFQHRIKILKTQAGVKMDMNERAIWA